MGKYLSSKSNTIAKKQHFLKKIVKSETLVQEFSSKVRNLRKIKLFQNKQSKLNVVYFNKLNRVNIVKTGEFCINNYLFLNKHAIESYLLQFFNNKKFIKDTNKKMQYKKRIKIKKNSTFFFNFRNKKLTVFKNARQAHWDFFTKKKKKLNERRYKNFLHIFLKKNTHFMSNIFEYFTFKFKLSYLFWVNFTNFLFFFFKKTKTLKQIYQLPISLSFWHFLRKYQQKKLKTDFKFNLWIFKRNKIRRTFWMQQKRKIPKFVKKKVYWNNKLKNSIHYDYITNYFVILKTPVIKTFTQDVIFRNKLLKLHDFRYKS